MQEIHDASPESGSYALFGFFGLPAYRRQKLGEAKQSELVIEQFVRLFGTEAENTSAILYKDWATDSETAATEDLAPLRFSPNDGHVPDAGVENRKIYFAGTENSYQFGGHLEGALHSAEKAVTNILNAKSI